MSSTNQTAISEFWSWFEQNQEQYLQIHQSDQIANRTSLIETLLSQLHRYCDHLYFELNDPRQEDYLQLVITAEGDANYFPQLEALVDAAPEIAAWQILKYSQVKDEDFVVEYQNRRYDKKEVIFIPLNSEVEPTAVGIRICYPDFQEAARDEFLSGTYMMLEALLGEKSTCLDINYIDLIQTPQDISVYVHHPIEELPNFILEKKGSTAAWSAQQKK